MTTNNKISNIVGSQVPFFVKNDHPQFILFLEAYYEFLEQNGQTIERIKNVKDYYDIDKTIDQFAEKLYDTYLKLFPKNMQVDKSLLMKHAKEFYLARGTEKSIRFLMNILFNEENIDFYYPKKDVLKASDGKWYVQQSLKISDLKINDVSNATFFGLEKFASTSIKGNTSGATAVVERVDRFYEGGTEVEELVLSDLRGEFTNGEQIFTLFTENGQNKSVTASVFGGVLNTVRVTNGGSAYKIGDPVLVQSNSGSGANVQVAKVTSGNIISITVLDVGSGFQNNDYLLITSTGAGSGANAYITAVENSGKTHPNTYNIYYSQISSEANTVIGNTVYSNLNSGLTDPANNWIANSLSSFVYSNTGPARAITVVSAGNDYSVPPEISVIANTRIQELGILGRMTVDSGGEGYVIGDTIRIDNVLFGYGTGAAANVTNVGANGTITEVGWVNVPGHITGGAGYSGQFMPTATVESSNANANGAIITVKSILGEGATFFTPNTTLGTVERLVIYNKGIGYLEPPTLDLTGHGDGKATAEATTITGVFKYPGRYLNDDGMLSTANYLEDRDYYQNFSYVLRLQSSINEYRQTLKDLIHPAGMKVFGEYRILDNAEVSNGLTNVISTTVTTKAPRTYTIANNVIITYTAHGLTNANSIYMEFMTGNIANYATASNTYTANSIYRVANVIDSNTFTVYSGKYLPGSINVNQLVAETGPSDIYMKEDGYNLFLIGSTGDRVYDFALSRKYDITTATLNKTGPTISALEGSPSGLTFKPDGTIMYICGTTGHRIIQYNMSEAWNVNSATAGLTFNVANAFSVTNLQAVQLSRDGTYMYFIDSGTDIVYQLSLTQAWNVNTASYLTQKYLGTFDGAFTSIYFSSNGSSMFLGGQDNDRIKEFRLSTSWNVNTATIYANSGSFNSFSDAMTGIAFANNGSMVYLTDTTYDLIHQLPMTQAWNVNTAFNGTSTTGNVMVGLVV